MLFQSSLPANYCLGGPLGCKVGQRAAETDFFSCGGRDRQDEQYSLGHDLNAAGGRYYNPAAVASVTAGVSIRMPVKRRKEATR
jgi:hypothetical protein